MLHVLTSISALATGAPAPTPWYESQLIGVVAGALVAGLFSWLRDRTESHREAERRKADRRDLRRDSQKVACNAFLAEARKAFEGSKRYEQETGSRWGDMHPEDQERSRAIEDALDDLGLEVPDNVYSAAVRLRDVLHIHVWEWDATSRNAAHATDEDVEVAEAELRRAARDLLASE
jgi:hypothetical protein